MSYLNWHVGMKVVCCEDRWIGGGAHEQAGVPCPLQRGKVYTIKSIQPFTAGVYGPGAAPIVVTLEGVTKPHLKDVRCADTFNATRFRPVQPRKTSIEVFTRILRNPHVRIREDA